MTVELEEFTEWRHRVETQLGRLEAVSDQHADRAKHNEGLRGSMDKDLGEIQVEFRAQRGMLQALHLTQNEHTAALRKLETGQEELRRGQQDLRQGQAKVLVGVQTILDLLKSAEGGGS